MDDLTIILMIIDVENGNRLNLLERGRLYDLRDAANPFLLEETKFKKLFRLPPTCVHQIVQRLGEGASKLHEGDIPAHLKVLCALNFYAQGSYQAGIGQDSLLALSQPTVSRVLTTVSDLIVERLLPQYISFPISAQEKASVKRGFQDAFGMKDVLGAVDGTHISIIALPITHPTAPRALFFNRKGAYSINAQVSCDSTGRITNVNANFPGSTHDTAVWGASNVNSHLRAEYLAGEDNQWMLGDKGYPALPWLLTPLPDCVPGTPQARYNDAHIHARNIIEKCFGRLKNKFRCIHKHRTLHYAPKKATKIFLACCTLHNMHLEPFHDEDDQMDQDAAAAAVEPDIHDYGNDFVLEGRATRERIINRDFLLP